MNMHLNRELAYIRQGELLADAEQARLAHRSRKAHRSVAHDPRFRRAIEMLAAATSAAAVLTATGALPH